MLLLYFANFDDYANCTLVAFVGMNWVLGRYELGQNRVFLLNFSHPIVCVALSIYIHRRKRLYAGKKGLSSCNWIGIGRDENSVTRDGIFVIAAGNFRLNIQLTHG